jgi:DNA-binding transcriptional ArsR family regulator
LTKIVVNGIMGAMDDVLVIDDPATAAAALDASRSRLLAELAEPASAAALAQRLGIARQKVNYHLRALETQGLVREFESKKWGGIIERRMVATARSYVVSPAALGPIAADPARTVDRLSASYLLALAARVVREVGALVRKAATTGKRLATLSIDTEIAFRSAEERAAFSQELTASLAALAARYHAPGAPGSRPHRIIVVAHATPRDAVTEPSSSPSDNPTQSPVS